ncbi:hypothetical protein [Bradyrhizobium elkanii]|uniref:hypothetical protein n=1 Tax=Bradyrhizobium elkanii TaxID=29448 RepID=UPI0004269B9A|nr:hypothetical protein [Bradyrhizobium elkanii]
MKNPFRKNPTHQLETTIASLTKRGDQLTSKRVTAQETLDTAIAGSLQAHLQGDLDDQRALDQLQAAVDSATSALARIDEAISVLAQQKAEAERQLTAERACIERAAAADKLGKQIAAIEAALPKYLEESRAFADALSDVGHFHFESGQMAGFVQNTMGQIEIAANFTLAELKTMPDAVRDGRQTIPREEPEHEPVAPIEPVPETRRLFALRAITWRDHEGRQRYAQQYTDADLTPGAAQRGLRIGAVVPLDDHRRKRLHGARGGQHVNPNAIDLLDLDKEAATCLPNIPPAIASDPVASADFRIIDRSAETRTLTIEVPRL